MEEAVRVLLESHDLTAAKDQDVRTSQMDSSRDGIPYSSNSHCLAVGGREAKSKAAVRDRTEEFLHKMNEMNSSSISKRKILLAMKKSLRKKLKRKELYAENSLSASSDSLIRKNLGCPNHRLAANGLVRKRSHLSHPCNVYSYYYPKYDMSYGHCLYVTPWTLDVAPDSDAQPTRLSETAKEVGLRSLERNWKMLGWKMRVNSARRSYAFPADAEWESTIYYFPRCDLSFYPLPFSKIRPLFGDDAKLPAETVLEDEEEDNITPSDNFGCWKDLVEFEERNTEQASCLTSDRTDPDSQSESSHILPNKATFSRTAKTRNPSNLCGLIHRTVPCITEGTWENSSVCKILKGENRMQINRSDIQLNEDGSEQDAVTMTTADLGAVDFSWQQADAENLISAEANYADATSPRGDGDFDRCRLTTFCRENEKISAEESTLTGLNKTIEMDAWKLNPKEAFHGIPSHSILRHNAKISRTHPCQDTNSSTRISEQVSNRKSREIEGNKKQFCKSFLQDDKSHRSSQRKEPKPSESRKQFKNKLTDFKEIPKPVSPERDLTHFDKETRTAAGRMHCMQTPAKEESTSVVEKQTTSHKCEKVERKTAMQKLVFVRSSASEVPYKTRAEDNSWPQSTLIRNSAIGLCVPERVASDQNRVQTATKDTENDAKTKFTSFDVGESTLSHPNPVRKSIQNTLRRRLKALQDRPLLVMRQVPKTYLSIWQNRRARYAEFLKRNPTFASISNIHHTNRSSSRLSAFSTRVSDDNCRSFVH